MRPERLLTGIAMLILLGALVLRPAAAPVSRRAGQALFRDFSSACLVRRADAHPQIFAARPSPVPGRNRHPVSPQGCREKLAKLGVRYENVEYEKICGARYMAPLFDPARQKGQDASACIDQFEFPGIPCAYPVVWVRAREAAEICRVMGKRLCDAHEWEGACAGALKAPDYRFDLARGVSTETAVGRMQQAHNNAHAAARLGLRSATERHLRRRESQDPRMRRRGMEGMRIQYLSRGDLSGLSQRPVGL
jgi:formylglycine-generating enzyme required for sulfatase activity